MMLQSMMTTVCILRIDTVTCIEYGICVANVQQTYSRRIANVQQTYNKRTATVQQTYNRRIADVQQTYSRRIADVQQTQSIRTPNAQQTYSRRTANVQQTYSKRIADVQQAELVCHMIHIDYLFDNELYHLRLLDIDERNLPINFIVHADFIYVPNLN